MTDLPWSTPEGKPLRTEKEQTLYNLVKEFFNKPVDEETKQKIKEHLRMYGYKTIGVDIEPGQTIIMADGVVVHENTNPYDERDQT